MATISNKAESKLIKSTRAYVCLSLILVLAAPADSLAIFSSKKSSLKLPVNDKIELEPAPADETEDATEEETDAQALKPISLDLSPVKLESKKASKAKAEETEASENKEGLIKGTIETSQFVPKSPLEGVDKSVLAPTSVKGSKTSSVKSLGGNLVDQAQSVNAAPLPLVASPEEAADKIDSKRELERQQLTALWEATLTRSPDINFVLQKLMPASDSSRVTSVMMRALTTAMYGGLGTLGAISPGPTSYMAQNLGYSAISQLLQLQDSKAQKKARVTQVEAIMLYKMVRSTADKLVEKYRDYKKEHHSLLRANSDFQDLQKMARDARDGQDASEQLEIEYTLRKAQREIEKIEQTVGKYRQSLVDLAGVQAVLKLDQEVEQEILQVYPELVNPSANPAVNAIAGDASNEQSNAVAQTKKKDESESEKIAKEEKNKQL